jgi:hypothetical protein
VAKNDVTLGISVETQKAIDDLASFKSKASSSFKALGAAAVAAGAAIAGALALKETIAAAQRQEDALQSVATAMGRLGEFSQEALSDMQAFASELQNVTGVGDEASLEMVALAKSFGATNEQAKLMTQASVELAAATGKSTDEAIRQVSKTLGGFAGELGEVNPAIKALTAEQLKNGEAARILLDTYGGTAAQKMNTFSGAVGAMQGRFGDFLETIGDLVIKNPVIIKLINVMGEAFNALGSYLANNRDTIISFINKGLISIIKVVPKALRFIGDLGKAFSILADIILFGTQGIVDFLQVFAGFDFISRIIGDLDRQFDILFLNIIKGVEWMLNSGFGRFALKQFGVDVEEVSRQTAQFRMAVEDTIKADDYGSSGLVKFLGDVSSGLEEASLKNQDFFSSLSESMNASAEETDKLIVKLEDLAKKGPAKITAPNVPQTGPKGASTETKQLIATNTSAVIKSMQQGGKEGAKALLSTIAVGIATALGAGPFSQTIADLLNLLMTDGAAKLILSLVDNLPLIVETLAYNMPTVAVALASTFASPAFYGRLAIAFYEGILAGLNDAFSDAIPTFNAEFGEALNNFGRVIGDFINGLPDRLHSAITAFVSDFKAAWVDVRNAILKPFQFIIEAFVYIKETIEDLVDSVSISNSGSNPGGFIGQIARGEFATGGQVPAGFPNDTFPARLTSGELVIPPGDTERLSSFLDKQDRVEGILTAIFQAVSAPISVQTTAEVDGRGLADIMLELSRRNARTA